MANKARRHHYIPQFILRKFADENGYLNYFNNETNSKEYLPTKEVFLSNDLYRNETNNPDNPTQLESLLSGLENDMSQIINKLYEKSEIILNKDEENLIKMFIFVMNFRSKRNKDHLINNLIKTNKINRNEAESLWFKNMTEIVRCRSSNDIANNKNIDLLFKHFALSDIDGCEGSYLIFYRISGKKTFILSDTYPVAYFFENGFYMKFTYYYFPISPTRMIVLAKNFRGDIPISELIPSKKFLYKPKDEGDKAVYKVGKVFDSFVEAHNRISINDSIKGYIFQENK